MNDKKIKILLVDDNDIVRLMFSNIFWLHGLDEKYELLTVSHTEEAENIINSPTTKPDIIFMGLVMPQEKEGRISVSAETGFRFLEHIKKDPSLSIIRVIIFSSFDDEDFKERALALGAERYLKKSESMPQDIIEAIYSLHPVA